MAGKKSDSDRPSGMKQGAQRLRIKESGDDGTFSGYGSVFGNEDSYGDIVDPNAFNETLAEHKKAGTLPALLWQHDPHRPIGIYTDMKVDDYGLWVEGKLSLDVQAGKEAHSLVKDGALTGLSIGFMVNKYEVDEEERTFTLLEIDLWEVSLVTFPANELSRVEGVKAVKEISGLKTLRDCEKYLMNQGGFSQRNATGMVAAIAKHAIDERDARNARKQLKASSDELLKMLNS